jgi:hypothetical protein
VYVADLADDRGQVFSSTGVYQGTFGEDVEPAPVPEAPAPASLKAPVCSNGKSFEVEIVKGPDAIPQGDLFELEVQVREGCRAGAPAENVVLEMEAVMPGHGHGMNTHPRVAPLAPGRFLVSGLRFHMPGRWEMHFDVVRDGVLERAQLDIALE